MYVFINFWKVWVLQNKLAMPCMPDNETGEIKHFNTPSVFCAIVFFFKTEDVYKMKMKERLVYYCSFWYLGKFLQHILYQEKQIDNCFYLRFLTKFCSWRKGLECAITQQIQKKLKNKVTLFWSKSCRINRFVFSVEKKTTSVLCNFSITMFRL